MMYIDYKNPGDVRVNTVAWHTGEKLPNLTRCAITCVQADGDELACVRQAFCQNFASIPNVHGKAVVIWREPWAAFIVDNLGV